MSKIQLRQVKIFWVKDYEKGMINYTKNEQVSLEKDVNDYIRDVYEKHGNYCEVETNSKFVTVIHNKLIEVNRE